MLLLSSLRYSCLPWLLVSRSAIAQGGCRGDTSIYNQNGLNVPFKNLCGKDIQKVVDFLDPTDELTWSDCLDRCVMKAPLCYGFDFTPYGTTDFSCWLMNDTFAEGDAKKQAYTVDAAMLSSDFLTRLSNDCRTLGLQGCFQKNGQLSANTSSLASKSNGLSTGAKAGIGAGVGVVALIAISIVVACVLKRRKQKQERGGPAAYSCTNDTLVDDDAHHPGMAELQADRYGLYGSPELEGSAAPMQMFAFVSHKQIHEIDGVSRYEK